MSFGKSSIIGRAPHDGEFPVDCEPNGHRENRAGEVAPAPGSGILLPRNTWAGLRKVARIRVKRPVANSRTWARSVIGGRQWRGANPGQRVKTNAAAAAIGRRCGSNATRAAVRDRARGKPNPWGDSALALRGRGFACGALSGGRNSTDRMGEVGEGAGGASADLSANGSVR